MGRFDCTRILGDNIFVHIPDRRLQDCAHYLSNILAQFTTFVHTEKLNHREHGDALTRGSQEPVIAHLNQSCFQ